MIYCVKSVVVVLYCIVVRCNMRERVEMYFWRAYREKLGIKWIQIFVFVFIAYVTHIYSCMVDVNACPLLQYQYNNNGVACANLGTGILAYSAPHRE